MKKAIRWMQATLWIPTLVLLFGIAQFAVWSDDDSPPFEILTLQPASGHAGDPVQFIATVRRDIDRNCSAVFTRSIYDATGTRFDFEGTQSMSAVVIAESERRTPGVMRVSIQLPFDIAVGSAFVLTGITYRCNPWHALWPIEMETIMPFDVLPP